MKAVSNFIYTLIITLIRACYGRFNSYRIAVLGMQELTKLYQFVADSRKPAISFFI